MHTKRISAYLATSGLVVGLGLMAAAGPAGAATHTAPTTGAAIGTPYAAGYQASGRDFRYIATTATIPDQTSFQNLFPQQYIELSDGSALAGLGSNSGSEYVRLGVETCQVALADNATSVSGDTCNNGTWVAFADLFDNALGGAFKAKYFTLGGGVSAGEGVGLSVYFNSNGGQLSLTVTPPTPVGATPVPGQTYTAQAPGAVFDHAAALDDFTSSQGGAPVVLPPFISPFALNSFVQGAVTTGNGQRGSFVGPWTTSPVIATSDGLPPPLGAERAYPDALYSDTYKANGAVRSDDAFDVWVK